MCNLALLTFVYQSEYYYSRPEEGICEAQDVLRKGGAEPEQAWRYLVGRAVAGCQLTWPRRRVIFSDRIGCLARYIRKSV